MASAPSDEPKVAMPLSKALYILATTHTRDDDVTGFVIDAYASPYSVVSRWPPGEYMRAWESVRAHIHLQTEPKA
jgi:hypothetical protein